MYTSSYMDLGPVGNLNRYSVGCKKQKYKIAIPKSFKDEIGAVLGKEGREAWK